MLWYFLCDSAPVLAAKLNYQTQCYLCALNVIYVHSMYLCEAAISRFDPALKVM